MLLGNRTLNFPRIFDVINTFVNSAKIFLLFFLFVRKLNQIMDEDTTNKFKKNNS